MMDDNIEDLEFDFDPAGPFEGGLRSAGSQFISVFNSLNVGIIIMKDWKVRWCNTYTEKIFARPMSDFDGFDFKGLFMNKNDFRRLVSEFKIWGDINNYYSRTLRLKRSNGEEFSVELALTFIENNGINTDEVIAIINDRITKKNLELDLRISSVDIKNHGSASHPDDNVLQTLNYNSDGDNGKHHVTDTNFAESMKSNTDGVVIIQDQVIKFANERFATMLGYESNELVGREFIDLIPVSSRPDGAPEITWNTSAGLNGEAHRSTLVKKDSEALSVGISSSNIHYNGKDADMILIWDTSNDRLINSTTLEPEGELVKQNQDMMDLVQMKSQIMSVLSRELRTPLDSIINYTDRMLEGLEGPITLGQLDNLSNVRKSGYDLLELINNILNFFTIQSGEMILSRRDFDLEGLFEHFRTAFKTEVERKHLKWIFKKPDSIPNVHGDAERISQVLNNLISNAVKYTKKGSVCLSVEDIPDRNMVKIVIQDSGTGVPDEKKKAIFDKFEQLDSYSTPQYSGSGLGLYISKHIVELHGGTIWVEDNPKGGAKFCFTLPKTRTVRNVKLTPGDFSSKSTDNIRIIPKPSSDRSSGKSTNKNT